ncbi:MAG: aminoacyl-tRNA hydrolase [Bacillota bacterium]|jgi:PTH1 family peptidyl-tRNA hydrolase|nr:aminoacyl-tRNA hydrolase [Bacillota bacterium]NLL26462.1 aminoacyl-tRNA hydrolase [Erysipelotrichia bacterium]
MKLIIGLGNPGKEYSNTRHNAGFLALDIVAKKLNVEINRKAFDSLTGKTMYKGQLVLLMKPQTYMNLSGEAVRKAVNYYQLNPQEDLIVIYDDLDINYGQIRLRSKGSAGGHKGMKSIIANIKTQEIPRIRIGIEKNPLILTSDYVLGKVEKEKRPLFKSSIEKAALAAIDFIDLPFDKVMNMYNKKEQDD